MSFILYEKAQTERGLSYKNMYRSYKLAGWNLIHKVWLKRGKPVNEGWSITADDLLKEHDEEMSSEKYALVIDFHPGSKDRIGLIELDRIHVYTYSYEDGVADWSPMMLELRNLFYEEEYEDLTPERKAQEMDCFLCPEQRDAVVEFLYLNGCNRSWNWGRNGMTNAAFLSKPARKYFQKFFVLQDEV